MDLPATSRLYNETHAAKFADQRLEARTRVDYTGNLRRFVEFCKQEGYPNPIQLRFVELPGVIAAYINRLATTNSSQWPAKKLRAALSWHYTRPEMLVGGHPHDRWVVETTADGQVVPCGNPVRSAAITQILAGLSKAIRRERTPKRASPMSLSMLSKLIAFLQDDTMFNKTMRLWVSAVCSLCFYGMCRINEVLLMKKGDIQLGLQRKSRKDGTLITFGCFTIRNRKTDHDPLASRTYSLHRWKAKKRRGSNCNDKFLP
ncbi:hypothetical protein F442_08171 [Phytophthora nicotianae P10297]|uniref:Core-binding (CB) domain-containing protein n=1 Tax=Phytophthora nicotianae P10297 TaxID=1317064 RepID=W2ZGV1_PHYNI|nr:hypothetical protein F442_08171 [Phytophthora nicotianae P10297]